MIWQCNGKYRGDRKCGTPHLTEDDIKRLFASALDRLLSGNGSLIEGCDFMYNELIDFSGIDAECAALTDEMETLSVRIEKLIAENAVSAMEQTDYRSRYEKLADRFEAAQKRLAALDKKRKLHIAEAGEIKAFADLLREGRSAELGYSDKLWSGLIDRVTVYEDERLVFVFKNGTEIAERL